MRKKKVILIGGTSYSGSTLLDMILANDDHGFSCGEVINLFQPFRPFHYNPKCGCGNDECTIWRQAKAVGESRFVQNIFLTQQVNTVVISSKNVFWISEQTKLLRHQGFDVRNVLIWKSPIQFAYSMDKRGKLNQWERAWGNYHINYLNFINDFISISYEDLVSGDYGLEDLCRQLGISHFTEKREYWNKKQHTLFGNTVTKYHQYDPGSPQFKNYYDGLVDMKYDKKDLSGSYRQVQYREVPDDFKERLVFDDVVKLKLIEQCVRQSTIQPSLKYSPLYKLKLMIGYKYRKVMRKYGLRKLK